MDELDSDDELLAINGRTAQRDIVQFVEMQKFVSGYGSQARWNKEMLAREVLFEIPDQLVGYMKSKNFKPGMARRHVQSQQSLAYTATPNLQMYQQVPDAPPAYSAF